MERERAKAAKKAARQEAKAAKKAARDGEDGVVAPDGVVAEDGENPVSETDGDPQQ